MHGIKSIKVRFGAIVLRGKTQEEGPEDPKNGTAATNIREHTKSLIFTIFAICFYIYIIRTVGQIAGLQLRANVESWPYFLRLLFLFLFLTSRNITITIASTSFSPPFLLPQHLHTPTEGDTMSCGGLMVSILIAGNKKF